MTDNKKGILLEMERVALKNGISLIQTKQTIKSVLWQLVSAFLEVAFNKRIWQVWKVCFIGSNLMASVGTGDSILVDCANAK